MKMDTRQQVTRRIDDTNNPTYDYVTFHFSPIAQTPVADDTSVPPEGHATNTDVLPWSPSRDIIPVYFDRNLPAPTTLDSDRRRKKAKELIDQDIDIRFASAREIASTSMELYIRGMISWDEYELLAFQPELHPVYDATIGALLGETAEPDKPRDFVRLWEERLAYERRYNIAGSKRIRAAERITLMMRRLAGITSIRA